MAGKKHAPLSGVPTAALRPGARPRCRSQNRLQRLSLPLLRPALLPDSPTLAPLNLAGASLGQYSPANPILDQPSPPLCPLAAPGGQRLQAAGSRGRQAAGGQRSVTAINKGEGRLSREVAKESTQQARYGERGCCISGPWHIYGCCLAPRGCSPPSQRCRRGLLGGL